MHEAGLSVLTRWQNFYVIIGSAAATLTGLLFVVATLTVAVRVRGAARGAPCTGQSDQLLRGTLCRAVCL